MIKDVDLGWLVGIIDGEGYIGLGMKGTGFGGTITIANTNKSICTKTKQLLDELLVPYTLTFQRMKAHHRMCEKINIYSYIGIERLLRTTKSLLVGKAEQASLLYKWVTKKMEWKIERSTECLIYKNIKELNQKDTR